MVTDKEFYVHLIQFCYQKHTTAKKKRKKEQSCNQRHNYVSVMQPMTSHAE